MNKLHNWVNTGLILLVGILVLVGGNTNQQPTTTPSQLGGITNYDQIGLGTFTQSGYGLNLPAATSTAFVQNATGKTQYVTFSELRTIANAAGVLLASSTYKFYVATTTNPFFTEGNYTAIAYSSLIKGWTVATSTTATSTSNYDVTGGVNGSKIIRWANGEWIGLMVQNGSGVAGVPQPLCNGSVCETSTSTNRGFDATVELFFYSTSTNPNPSLE